MLYSISICGKNTCSPLYASYMFILSSSSLLSFYTRHCNIIIYLRLDIHACTLHILRDTFYPLIMLSVVVSHVHSFIALYNAKMILWHWALLGCDDDQFSLVVLYSSQHNGSQELQWMSVSSSSLLLIYFLVLLCYLYMHAGISFICMQESHCAVSLQFPAQLYASFITLLHVYKSITLQIYTL